MSDAEQLLRAWIRDYGAEKTPAFIANLEAILAENAALRAVLKSVEWNGTHRDNRGQFWRACPECRHTQNAGHAADCALAKVLGDEK